MAINEILPFAGDGGANVQSQAVYAADPQRLIGHQPGIAKAELENKALRQSSLIASAVAAFIAAGQATDVVDTLTPAQIYQMFVDSLLGSSWGKAVAAGTPDALTADFTPNITALVNGQTLIVEATAANTAAATLAVDAIAAKAIVKGSNAALAAGDIAGANHWLMLQYDLSLDKFVLLNPATGVTTQANGHGQCRLDKVGANLVLTPKNGNRLIVNGVSCTVPNAGVSLAPTGLSATTLYYIYAVATAGAVTSLEASATGHSKDATTGVEIKTGDATRTLVGMAYCKTAATFADTDAQRFVVSYFNRRNITGRSFFTANRTISSGTFAEINSEIRAEFVCWSDEATSISITGAAQGSAAGFNNTLAKIAVDATGADGFTGFSCSSTFQAIGNICISSVEALNEGYHYSTLFGANSATFVSTFYGTASPGDRCVNSVLLRG